jgi:hypothetical protein
VYLHTDLIVYGGSIVHIFCHVTAALVLFVNAALDTFVDYTWRDLTGLSLIIVLLLVVEVSKAEPAAM